MTPPPDDATWLVIASAITFVSWLPNTLLSARLWLEERSARAFRAVYVAFLLQVGLLRIVFSTAARNWPNNEWVQLVNNLTAPILTILLVSGGLVAWWTWRSLRRW
jgi:hypothetical protein